MDLGLAEEGVLQQPAAAATPLREPHPSGAAAPSNLMTQANPAQPEAARGGEPAPAVPAMLHAAGAQQTQEPAGPTAAAVQALPQQQPLNGGAKQQLVALPQQGAHSVGGRCRALRHAPALPACCLPPRCRAACAGQRFVRFMRAAGVVTHPDTTRPPAPPHLIAGPGGLPLTSVSVASVLALGGNPGTGLIAVSSTASLASSAAGGHEGNKTLYLGNLHPFVTEATLQDVFAGLGGITELKVRGRGAAARCGSSAEPRGCAAAGYLRRAAAGAPRRVVATLQSRSFFFWALAAAP